jgi:creatinine amidohydrolase/Fe(II)-dependent formamide hydrolase-like protein
MEVTKMLKRALNLFLLLTTVSLCVGSAQAQVYRLADLNTEQIRALNPAKTVIIIPGGILEEHGPYLPSYTDGFSAEAYSRELAHAIVSRPGWNVLMFPEIPLGAGGANSIGGKDIYPGSYNVSPSTLRTVYMDLASTLGEQGFRWIFVVFMHDAPNNHLALEQASDYFQDVYGGNMVHLWDLKPIHDCCDAAKGMLTPEQLKENGFTVHAGTGEHSEMLFLRPDLVSPAIHDAPSVTAKDLDDLVRIATQKDWPGYWGAPRYASAALGAASFHGISEKMNSTALQILDGLDWQKIPRFSDEQIAQIRAAGGSVSDPEKREQRESEWLKSKKLH